jgi:sulfate adenylyltransferase
LNDQRGLTIFLTGLSGAGKTTIAASLAGHLGKIRPVTLLDGDAVRHHMSSELGFSRPHRELNIRRVGFVASEVTKHGGICICALIAPYDEARKEARRLVEQFGTFILIYVSTPLEVCETRDSKGLYARARSGDLPAFTGVTDPYEQPQDAEILIDTSQRNPMEAVDSILSYLRDHGCVTV